MLAVASFDWSQAPTQLAIYVAKATKRATPPTKCRVSENGARDAAYEHYRLDKKRYATFDNSDREEMINLLMECVEVEAVYQAVMDAKAELGPVG